MLKVLAMALLAACLALATSACGGENEDSADEAATLVADQLTAICDEWRAALDARGDFPVEDFDPESPSAEDLPSVGDYFGSGIPAQEEAIAAMQALDVPVEVQPQVDDLVSAVEQGLASVRKQVAAARAGDVDGFVATLEEASAAIEGTRDAANAVDAGNCAV